MLSIQWDKSFQTQLRLGASPWENVMQELSAREKARALREAKDYLESVNGDSGISPTIREVVTAGLSASGYWFVGVGSNREKTTSIEIGRALGLKDGLPGVSAWGKNSDRKTILAGLDTTIMNLQ